MLARVHKHLLREPNSPMVRTAGATFMKFGLAPTTCAMRRRATRSATGTLGPLAHAPERPQSQRFAAIVALALCAPLFVTPERDAQIAEFQGQIPRKQPPLGMSFFWLALHRVFVKTYCAPLNL